MIEEGGKAFMNEALIKRCEDPRSMEYIRGHYYTSRSNYEENDRACKIDISAGNKVNKFYRLLIISRCRDCHPTATINLCSHGVELCEQIQTFDVSC